MKYRVEGPDGSTHLLEADSEAALHDAIEQLWDIEKEPEPEKADPVLEVLERIASRPDPEFPKAEPVDFSPIERAIGKLRLEPQDVAGPLELHGSRMALALDSQTAELRAALAFQAREITLLRNDLLGAIAGLHAALVAPRELVRDRQGRALRSEIVT